MSEPADRPDPGHGFEGSYLGDATRIGPDTRLECKICWHVYDPAAGDPQYEIPPGTPFADLPDHWRCPQCDGDREQFMVLGDDRGPLADPADRLQAAFERIHRERMQGLPILNSRLAVAVVGGRVWCGHWIGVLVTPWCMNLVALPRDGPTVPECPWVTGATRTIALPAGSFPFVVSDEPGLGPYACCSLVSPMGEFPDQGRALAAARASLDACFAPQSESGGCARTEPKAPGISRRDLLRGGIGRPGRDRR